MTVAQPGEDKQAYSDILIANILLEPLVSLAPVFQNLMKSNSLIAISGILSNQVDEIKKTYNLKPNRNEVSCISRDF